MALTRNAELLAMRQRITETQSLLRQAGFRLNPGIDVTGGPGSFLGSSGEHQVSAGYSHFFELSMRVRKQAD